MVSILKDADIKKKAKGGRRNKLCRVYENPAVKHEVMVWQARDMNRASLAAFNEMLWIASLEEIKMQSLRKAPVYTLAKITADQRTVLLDSLLKLCGQSGWKVN